MQVDEPTAGAAAPAAQAEPNFLMDEKVIRWWSHLGKEKYKQLKPRTFTLTSVYSPWLLQDTVMDAKFDFIFQVIGWQNFWNITESGSRALTMEFFCTLNITDMGVGYRFFRKEYSTPWKDLSILLGFDA